MPQADPTFPIITQIAPFLGEVRMRRPGGKVRRGCDGQLSFLMRDNDEIILGYPKYRLDLDHHLLRLRQHGGEFADLKLQLRQRKSRKLLT